MKTLTKPGKAFAATALAAAILLGGPAAAAMAETSEPVHLPGVTANSVLTEAITLKTGLGGAPIYDTINGTMTSGIGALFPSEAMSDVAFPASGPIMRDDGTAFRAIGIERCGLPVAMYYISDIAAASSVPRTDATDAKYRSASATDTSATQHTGVAIHYGDASPLPMLMPSSDVNDPTYTANTCAPNAALAFKPEGNTSAYPGTAAEFAAGITHKKMTEAANDAIADRSAARGAAELERAQTGYSAGGADVVAGDVESPAGIWMLAAGGVAFTAFISVMIVRANKTEAEGK